MIWSNSRCSRQSLAWDSRCLFWVTECRGKIWNLANLYKILLLVLMASCPFLCNSMIAFGNHVVYTICVASLMLLRDFLSGTNPNSNLRIALVIWISLIRYTCTQRTVMSCWSYAYMWRLLDFLGWLLGMEQSCDVELGEQLVMASHEKRCPWSNLESRHWICRHVHFCTPAKRNAMSKHAFCHWSRLLITV